MLTPYEFEQRIAQRERALKAEALTPQHSAAEAAMGGAGEDEAEEAGERRERVQHLADPVPPEVPEVAHVDLGKVYRDAADAPSGYGSFGPVNPEAFRRGPVTEGHAAYSPGYDPSARPVPVPSAALSAAAVSRPPLTDGRAAPYAEGC
jgi:hypothetical protein